MSHILHRAMNQVPPLATGGEGVYLIDEKGNRYLDACGGAAVSALGHNHPDIIEALHKQIDQLAYAHTSFFTTEVAEQLADFLADRAPGNLNHVYLVSGGSEAIETALKLAHQYHVERGDTGRRYFIARQQSFHGNTLGALSVGGNQWRRKKFEPILIDSRHIPPCYAYRYQQDEESEEDYGLRAANELETMIRELGPDKVIAFIAEPVVGATMGCVPAAKGYFKRIREICDQHGILLILDEVMCGMGRTGTLFAQQQDGIVADITTTAKGLGAGYQPIGATLLSSDIYQALADGSGIFMHGHTYIGHAVSAAAALSVQRVIERDKLLENVNHRGEQIRQTLAQRFANNPYIGDIRGRGLFIGVEFVADRETKEPLPTGLGLHSRLQQAGMNNRLMIYPMLGTIDGRLGYHLLLAPPFILSRDEADELVERVVMSVDDAFKGLTWSQ